MRYIYLTHAHADHFPTTNHLLRRFPDATVVATEAVLARIARETPGGAVSDRYRNFSATRCPNRP
ncbi:hypothetical protein Ade02nite_13170 [Paractinoplanes deccanensis]|uniref:Metallo-beta-lactamase domain-containing protein n=1 Tax=Paractinoplanes deccanensis TaxID=113561 RepID=A0ABQ3XY50_9ACTN|nr:hypothetical protein [Actinoplanes deccanensis]GID72676.1 hypothetical protein Ade02nite_13170 [Actinoplanes deccanensis]